MNRLRQAARTPEALPVLGLAAYVAILAARLGDLLHQTYRFADVPMVPVVAAGWRDGRGRALLVTQDSIVAHLYDAALAHTPAFGALAMAFGPLLTVASALLMAVGARHVAGRGALITLALALAVPPVILWADLQQNNHLTTVLITALLGWHLVLLLRGRRSLLRSLLIGVASGVCVISDPQALVSGLLPFILTAALLRPRARRVLRPAMSALAVTVVAATVSAAALQRWMESAGIGTITNFVPQPSGAGIVRGAALASRGLVWMTSGGWYGDGAGAATVAGAVLALLVVALPVVVLWRAAHRLGGDDDDALTRLGYAVYWTLSGCAIVGAFLLSGDSYLDVQAHYVIAVFYAAAALAPLAAGPLFGARTRTVAIFASTAVIALAASGLLRVSPDRYATGVADPADAAVAAQLQAQGLHHGYAAYWDSYDLDWLSDRTLDVWPVTAGRDCGGGAATVCAYGSNTVTGAYAGSDGPTFVVVRAHGSGCVHVQPDPARFGTPERSWTTGDLTVYVYAGDVASHFNAATAPYCTTD